MTTIITSRRADVHVRWLINRDMPEVMEIENTSFPFSWSREDFRNALRQRNYMASVAEIGEKVVGFAVYSLHAGRLEIENIAVHPDHRRQGIGASIVASIARRLSPNRRSLLRVAANEENTISHFFWKACGFRAVAVIPNFWEGFDFSAYVFEFRVGEGKR